MGIAQVLPWNREGLDAPEIIFSSNYERMEMMLILKIIAVVLLLAGFGTVLEAKNLVTKFKTDQNIKVTFEHEMDEEEMQEYKLTKATVNMKMLGMLIALPGIILTLIAFK